MKLLIGHIAKYNFYIIFKEKHGHDKIMNKTISSINTYNFHQHQIEKNSESIMSKKNADLSHLQRLRQFLDTFHSQEGSNPFIRAENRS